MSQQQQNNVLKQKLVPLVKKFQQPQIASITAIAVVCIIISLVVITDYLSSIRITSLSDTTGINARNGKIIIQYSHPAQSTNYTVVGSYLHVRSQLSDDGLTEIHTIVKPTPYNQQFALQLKTQIKQNESLGWFLLPEQIPFTTGMESVSIKKMIPAANTRPAPETLNNQLIIQFNGEIIGKYKPDINIPIAEMDFLKLTPAVSGYYRWINESTLAFNFTESKPEFEQTYHFDIFPEKIINKNYQVWNGDSTEIEITTSINEVYVEDFSLRNETTWRAPLRIEFSGNMVDAAEVLQKKHQSLIPISISPQAGGYWQWTNARTLVFYPDNISGWPVRQTVVVSIKPEINNDPQRKWRYDNRAKQYSFYVKPREQSIVSYNLHGDSVKLDEELIIKFSRAMVDKFQLRKKIPNNKITGNIPFLIKPHIDGEFYWTRFDKLKFRPADLWSELTEYTITLNPDYNPDRRYEWTGTKALSFKTIENLLVAEYYLVPEIAPTPTDFFTDKSSFSLRQNVPPENRLWILFDKDIGQYIKPGKDMREFVRIEPQLPGKYNWLSNTLLEFIPEQNWPEKSNINIRLSHELLQHPQQHFRPGNDRFTFTTRENLADIAQVTLHGKEPGLQQQPHTPLLLTFSKNMHALPKVGQTYWSNEVDAEFQPIHIVPAQNYAFKWKDRRNLELTPETYWRPETRYILHLNKKLLPQKQAKFADADKFFMLTDKNVVSISSFTPQLEVEQRIVIDVEFDRNIRPAKSNIGEPDKTELFEITPRLTGTWNWLADNKIQFKPSQPLQTSTAYTVKFDPNKIPDKQFSWHRDKKEGEKYYAKDVYSFYTPALHIKSADARFEFDKNNLLKQRFYLDIELSTNVKAADLRKHFSIWYETQKDKENIKVPLVYTLQFHQQQDPTIARRFSVVSDWIDRPASDRNINYTITKGLKPVIGNLELEDTYSNYFLQEQPKNIGIHATNWNWQDNHLDVTLNLNAPVEPDSLKQFLTISNLDNNSIVDCKISVDSSHSSDNYAYRLSGNFIPSTKYKFFLRKGLLAADGAFTSRDIFRIKPSPGLSSEVKFATPGNILSRKDLSSLPILTTNPTHDSIEIAVDKIHANNLNYYLNNDLHGGYNSNVAKRIIIKRFHMSGVADSYRRDKQIISHIDVSTLFADNPHGLYRIQIKGRYTSSADARWFLSTDIGLFARHFNNNLLLWANSLHSSRALSNVKIAIYDRWNQVISAGTTDGNGFIQLSYPQDSNPTHIIASLGQDFSFIDLQQHTDNLSAYDIEGFSAKDSRIRSFIYSDRGVYRPGETVHLVAVSRDRDGILPDAYPATFRLINPVGKEIVAERYNLDRHGIYVYDFQIPAEAKTGKWRANVDTLNSTDSNYTFQVEEFIPNKIKVNTTVTNPTLSSGDIMKLKVSANNLFGPPAAGRRVNGSIKLLPNYFKPRGHTEFSFGHDDNKFQHMDFELVQARLNDAGEYTYEYQIPNNIDSPIGITASYSATVIDDGGRGVTHYGQRNVLLYKQYVGIRRLSKQVINLDTRVGFEVINVDAKGSPIEKSQQKLQFRVYRNKTVTHYRKNERGYYRYVTEKQRILVDELHDIRDGYNKFNYQPRYSGEHILEVEDQIGKQISRYKFYVSGGDQDVAARTTDKVQMKVLTPSPQTNQPVEIEIQAPFAGKLFLIGEREKVLFTRIIDVDREKHIIAIPVKAEYLPNFYISAMVIKPVPQGDRLHPIYATGLINVNVKDPSHAPDMDLTLPKHASPNSQMSIEVAVADTNASEMFFTIAAVDVGILELTKYKMPDMQGYFSHKRRLEVNHLNMYPLVMPYESDIKNIIDPSGDAPSRALIKKKRVNPDSQQRVKSVALWSGLQKLDTNGKATIKFDLPDFDGRLRVMAVAYGNQRFASSEKEVVVRDKLVLKPTLPRFLSTGDNFVIPVKLFNATGIAGDVDVRIQTTEHLKIQGNTRQTIALGKGSEAQLNFSANVMDELGVAEVILTVKGLNTYSRKIIKLPVRTPATLITVADSGDITTDTPRTIKMPNNFIDGTQEYALKLTSNRMTKFSGSLKYLLRYPHGCLEQTTSRVFPLLYYSDLASASGQHFSAGQTPRYYVREGIKKIERMQLEDGRFSYWEGTNVVNNWAYLYSSHFLVEARRAGFKIDEAVWNNMLYQLKQSSAYELSQELLYDRSYGVTHVLYALYILAIADENISPRLNHIYDYYLDELKLHDKARLAAAYAASGETNIALELIKQLSNISEYDDPYRDTGGNFASNVRDMSMILDALVLIDSSSPQIPVLIDKLAAQTRNSYWGTTQENAFAFLAIGRALAKSKATNVNAKIRLGDGSLVKFDKSLLLRTPELLKGSVRVEVSGKGQLSYIWEAVGIDKAPKSLQVDESVRIRRRLLDKNGQPLTLSKLRQGDLVVVELRFESLSGYLENMVITNLLPMGLEIENARLSTSASLSWIRQSATADYVDIRDDRINIFLNVNTAQNRYYFTTRAVTAGNFSVPPVRMEAMYNPDIFSESGRSTMHIAPLQ